MCIHINQPGGDIRLCMYVNIITLQCHICHSSMCTEVSYDNIHIHSNGKDVHFIHILL